MHCACFHSPARSSLVLFFAMMKMPVVVFYRTLASETDESFHSGDDIALLGVRKHHVSSKTMKELKHVLKKVR